MGAKKKMKVAKSSSSVMTLTGIRVGDYMDLVDNGRVKKAKTISSGVSCFGILAPKAPKLPKA